MVLCNSLAFSSRFVGGIMLDLSNGSDFWRGGPSSAWGFGLVHQTPVRNTFVSSFKGGLTVLPDTAVAAVRCI